MIKKKPVTEEKSKKLGKTFLSPLNAYSSTEKRRLFDHYV